ncbi:hypothetical protein JMA_07520 [Jeotgalibacillus malaysiensis]|uniref:Uncharacterized protein n=1 Tax=Jeotgalibacillus malaysiensis TaxID=1508404 RepID=A0A0B5APR1_9BACL|nr:hypothetical protein [Jeotgalibacillus malaysiensis]AJD90069.1 hypothetical protein JMA_07520 [Jeotgalibacillus malaysiensis]
MKLKKSAKIGLTVISLTTAAIIAVNMFASIPEYNADSASDYLKKELAYVSNQGAVTDSFKVYGGNEEALYIWYAFEEFLPEKNETGSGASLAVKLLMEDGRVTGHEVPEEGELYEDSMKELFPWHVRWRMPDGEVPLSLEKEIDIKQARLIAALEEQEE